MTDSYGDALLDAVVELTKFVAHTPEAARTIAAACLSLWLASTMLLIMLHMRLRDRAKIHKYGLDADPDADLILTYDYSQDGTLEIRSGGCRILRSGAAVSGAIDKILSITCQGDADSRIVSIIYEDPESDPRTGDKLKTERICCGRMSDEAYETLRSHMLQQAGG